ncbi:MAG: hypothetical protein H8E82_06865 [Candidatus Marinimicrobia bacterium]|nr:hypothetical protein [Candidatus Neomarinimicrobiota bacterium]
MMDLQQLYTQFENLAEQMNITILIGEGDFIGGYCTVNDDQFIVLNKRKTLEQRLRILAQSFGNLSIQDRYIIPVLREFIESVVMRGQLSGIFDEKP